MQVSCKIRKREGDEKYHVENKLDELIEFINAMNITVSLPNSEDLKAKPGDFGLAIQDTSPKGQQQTEDLILRFLRWLPIDKVNEARDIMATWNQVPKT